MKEWLKSNYRWFLLPVIMLFVFSGGCNKNKGNQKEISEDHIHESENEEYTCPMHPEVRQKEPGICPICKMDLVKAGDEGEASGLELGNVIQPADKAVLSGIKTVSADSLTVYPEIEVHGTIDYDSRLIKTVSANYRGRIDKLYMKYNYQFVSKGDALVEIFSEELQNAQENYLFLLKNDQEAKSLINASKEKLQLLGMSSLQIENLRKSGKVSPRTTIYSQITGVVMEKIQEEATRLPVDQSVQTGMTGMENEPGQAKRINLKEGMYVGRGETIFTIIPTDRLSALLEVHGSDVGWIRQGQKLKLKAVSTTDSLFESIDLIHPDFGDGKNLRIRTYLNNQDGKLLVGDLISGTVVSVPVTGRFLPESSVLDLGERKIVFVLEQGVFKVKPVKTGVVVGKKVQILDGVTPNDKIAVNAFFLVDSESFIKTETK